MSKFSKSIFIIAAAILAVLSLSLLTRIYPDILWFESFGFLPVWLKVFNAKAVLFGITLTLAFLWLAAQILITQRISKNIQPTGPIRFNTPFAVLNEWLYQVMAGSQKSAIRSWSSRVFTRVLLISAFGLSVLMALAVMGRWELIYLYLNQVPFNIVDPIFQKDLSFFVFGIPFWNAIQGSFLSLSFISIALVGWIYFSKNILFLIFNIRTRSGGIRIHLFLLVALWMLLLAWGAYLDIYEVVQSSAGVVFGAGYTDVHVHIPMGWLRVGLYLAATGVFIFWAFRQSLKIPAVTIMALVVIGLLGNIIVPGIIQNYVVSPNELQKEQDYIQHNIEFTRNAYQLNTIEVRQFPASDTLTTSRLKANQTTIDNIRLWNEGPLKETFSQLQEIRLYYEFGEIDVDRYMIDGQLRQVMIAPREMNASKLSVNAQTWVNRHLTFTHGYGIVMSPVNKITADGLPEFFIKDIPPTSDVGFVVDKPAIYFGESNRDYLIVNTKQEEFDYPKGDNNVYTHYTGEGGIQLKSMLRRFVFATKFSDYRMLISTLITSESRLLYDHDIRTITQKLAPFLIFDQDPYLVLTPEGRQVWVQDAYTYSDKYPYSEPFTRGINYIRNAVKITIDAYDGTTRFYISDPKDPLIQAYAKFYGNLLQPFSEMPDALKTHIRYPKDLFTIQSEMYKTYHMTDVRVFYNREDVWAFPKTNAPDGRSSYYTITKIPGDDNESFIMMQPFTPTNKNNMIAWMAAKCDLDEYGQLLVFKFPKERTIFGPSQIESRVDQDTEISQDLTLWGQLGSQVIRGNLMVIPIDDSILYVQPIYLQATQSKLPELKRVIVAYSDRIVMSDSIDAGIREIFGGFFKSSSKETKKTEQTNPSGNVAQKVKEAFRNLKAAAKNQDWVDWGKQLQTLDQWVERL